MKNINELYEWYENLTIQTVEDIGLYYAENAFLKDPFNEINGRDKIKNIFYHMFKELEKPHFVFIDKILQGDQAFVTWDFHLTLRKQTYVIHGSSHLKLDQNNLVIYHRDYWDVGEELLLKVPLLKNLYGAFRKKMASHSLK